MSKKRPRSEDPDTYLSINQTCARFGISRRTFYRLLADEPGLAALVIRIPPGSGRIRVPLNRFERWLLERQ